MQIARDIILRRRAALVAAAMGSMGAHAAVASADTIEERDKRGQATRLLETGEADAALEILFTVDQPSVETLLLRGRILRDLGRYAAARTALTIARKSITDPDRGAWVDGELDDLADRTVELVIHADRDAQILVDGKAVGSFPLPGPLFVAPGRHVVGVEGAPDKDETIDAAGGARIELELWVHGPQVCLSFAPADYTRRRPYWAAGAAPSILYNTAREDGVPLAGAYFGAYGAMSLGFFHFHAGPVAGVFGSERGVAALGGGRFGVNLAVHRLVAVGLGTEIGYFHIDGDEPEPAEGALIPGLRTTPSFFVKPEVGFSVMAGPVEAGPRVGVMLSRAEEDLAGRFGATYVSAAMWVTYVHLP